MTVGKGWDKGRVSSKMKQELVSAFGDLLKPERVKALRVTHAGTYVVLGFVLTTCPVENRSYLKDFEAHLAGRKGRFIDYAVVDGRRLAPAPDSTPMRQRSSTRD